MYYDRLQNVIGKPCVCCEKFIPTQGEDELGHEVHFAENPMGLCSECFKALVDLIKEKKATKEQSKY